MGIFNWFRRNQTQPYLTVRPQNQTNNLVSHINYFDKETYKEENIILQAINDISTGKRKPNTHHAEDILKGYLFGIIFARQIMLDYRQPSEIYKDLEESEDFKCVWQAISTGTKHDWRNLPRPPVDASETVMGKE